MILMIIFSSIAQFWMLSLLWRQQQKLKEESVFISFLFGKLTDLTLRINRKNVRLNKETEGKLEKHYINAKLAEKTAERAFSLASTASLGVIALQKALATPRYMTKNQTLRNELAKKELNKVFNNDGKWNYLYDTADDDEREALDAVLEKKTKEMENHS